MKALLALILLVFISLGEYAHAQTTAGALLLPAPTALSATDVTTSGFVAHWTSPGGSDHFFVDVSTDSVVFDQQTLIFSNIPAGQAKAQAINGFFPNTVCFYRVQGESGAIRSAYSNSVRVHILPPIDNVPPAAPIEFSARLFYANGVTTQHLSWLANAESDISHYNIYSIGVVDPRRLVGTVAATVSIPVLQIFDRTEPTNIGPNFYNVTAVDQSGNESAPSVTLRVGIVPAQPNALAATNITTDGFTANWDTPGAVPGGWQFFVDVSTDPVVFDQQTLIFSHVPAGSTKSTAIRGFSPGTLCYYRVSAENIDGTSTYSNSIRVRLFDNVPPAIPAAFSASLSYANGVTTQRLFWISGLENDISHFNIYVMDFLGQAPRLFASVPADHVIIPYVFNRTDPANIGPNFYSLTAVDESGNESAPTVILRVGIVPAQPTALAATNITADGFTANWDTQGAVPVGWQFFVDVSTDPAVFDQQTLIFSHVPAGSTKSTAIRGFSPGTLCYYRVSAENIDGTSTYSNSTTVLTLAVPTPFFTVYPNPSSSLLSIELPTADESNIAIRDSNGNLMKAGTYNQTSIKVAVDGIPKGTYYLSVLQGGATTTQRVLID